MNLPVPRPRKQYLQKETNRHGTPVWYVRIGKGTRTRIKGDYGSVEFEAAYNAAVHGSPTAVIEARRPGKGTIAWAVRLYRHSEAWANLSPATRRQRENIFQRFLKTPSGNEKLSAVTRLTIKKALDRRASTPSAARHFLHTMRGLFAWAIDEEHISADPTAGFVAKAAKSEGHPVWTDEDVHAYERRWPLGTRERVAFDVLLWTGLRRGDAVRVGRPHVKDGIICIKTEKTGQEVYIVMCEALRRSIDAGPCGDLTFIAGQRGLPRVKESFGEWFRVACNAAGVKKSAHGLRKAAATRVANNGATEKQLEAIFGWSGGRMASLYTKSADRKRIALAAAGLLGPESGTSIPAPGLLAPAPSETIKDIIAL